MVIVGFDNAIGQYKKIKKAIPILQGSDVPKLRQAVIEKRGFRAPGVSGTGEWPAELC